jgi:DNA excision repair protein ERCC-2
MAIVLSKLFMRSISQTSHENQTGISLWTVEDIEKAQAKQKEAELELARLQNQGVAMDEDEYGDGGIDDQLLEDIDLDL